MKDEDKARKQLIDELAALRRRVAGLENDLADRRAVEESLRETSETLQAIIVASPVAIIAVDRDGKVITWSPAAERIFGWSEPDVIGRFNPVVPEPKLDEFRTDFRRVLGGEEYSRELRRQKQDGSLIDVSISTAPLRNAEGEITGAVAIMDDITERRRMQAVLRDSEARYRRIVDTANEGIWSVDGDFITTFVNRRMARMLGYDEAEMIGQPVRWFMFQEDLDHLHQKMGERRTGISDRYERRYRHKDGRAVWVILSVTPLFDDKNGTFEGSFAMATDITERKQAEVALRQSQRQLANIIDFLPDATFVIDKQGRVISWNRAIEDMTGISSAEMVGKDNFEYALPFYGQRIPVLADLVRDPQTVIEKRYSSFQMERDILKGELVVPCLKGKERILSSRAAPIYDNLGEIVGVIESVRDITEQKLMEEALLFEHQKLAAILDGSPISSFVIDREHRVTAWNKVNEFFTGIPKEEVLWKPLDLSPLFKDKTPPSLAVLVLELSDEEIIRRYAHQGLWRSKIHPEAFESTGSIWIKGKEHIMAIQATRLRDAAGNVVGAIQCAEDITEQKRAEEALQESEELYRTALESSYDGVAMIQDGRYIYFNQKLLDTLGWKREQMIGKPIGLRMHPDDRATVLGYYDNYLKGLPIPDHFEVRVVRPDGAIVYADVSAVEVTYQGKETLLAYFRNITDRKHMEDALRQSEQKYRDVFNATSDALFVHDEKGNILDVNERMCAMFQCDRHKALTISLNDISLGVSPYSETEGLQKVRQAIEEGPQVFEWQTRRISGEVFWSEVALRAYGTGGETRVVASVRDINERKRAEEERLQLEQRLRQAEKAESLSRMAGAIAHHFNSLLGAAMGRLELALRDLPPAPKPRNHLTEAMKASQQAADISRLMLTYLGHTVAKKGPCNLVQAVRETLLGLTPSLPQGVKVKTELPPEAVAIEGDKVHVEQALTNLILNAAEAIGDDEGEITLAVAMVAADKLREFHLLPSGWEATEDGYAAISIADTGSGLDPDTMARIFDPFFSTKFTGRGLGLAVVLGIVRAHGGALAVESQPGVGSVFRVFLPLLPRQTSLPDQEPTVGSEAFRDGGLVLVVDDEPVVRTMSEEMLKSFGYEVIVARDGLEALEKFRERRDDIRLVLLDQSLPGMSGWETLAALRALRSDLRVVLTSGYDEAQVMRGDHPEQPQVFLRKPYYMKDLEAALDAARKHGIRPSL